MTVTDLERRVAAHRWYHSIDLGGGIVRPASTTRHFGWRGSTCPPRCEGITVLDVGAWDGFFSFECERRGAARVVAADYYSWHGSGWGAKAGFELAREALGSRVEDVDVDVMDIAPGTLGTFDLVLFLGVLYHLRHPLLAIEKIAAVTRGTLILETVVDLVGLGRPPMAFYPERELNADPTNWWGPNQAAVMGMLKSAGFDDVQGRNADAGRALSRRACRVAPAQGKEPARYPLFVRIARSFTRENAVAARSNDIVDGWKGSSPRGGESSAATVPRCRSKSPANARSAAPAATPTATIISAATSRSVRSATTRARNWSTRSCDWSTRTSPIHVSIVGGEPLVRFRELDEILPQAGRPRHLHAGRHQRGAADSQPNGPRSRACRWSSRSTACSPSTTSGASRRPTIAS